MAGERKINLNRFLVMALLMLLSVLMLIVGIFGNYGMAVVQRQQRESMDYILSMYKRNMNGALVKIENDLQDILSSQTTLQMMLKRSDLQRWHASYSLSALLASKRASTTEVDGYAVMDSVYNGFILSRSSNIAYEDLGSIEKYLKKLSEGNIQNSGWVSAKIGQTGYLLKYYNYGGIIIAAMVTEQKVQEILSYGQDPDKSVEFYITDSAKKVICSSNPEWKYGEMLSFDNAVFAPEVMLHSQKVMDGAYYVVGSIEKAGVLGQTTYFFIILGLLVASLLFLLIILRFVNREVVVPMKILTDTSEKIRQGDLTIRPGYSCKNKEMSELKDTYVTMLDTIMELKLQEYERIIQVKDSELKYMHMQLKPHFFLNALSTINSMAYQDKNEDIHEFIQVFSRNIRYMFKVGLHTVRLEEEVNNLEDYLAMQRLLYKDSFYAYFDIPEETRDYRIPQMILHTFIENIFKHVVDINSFVSIFMSCCFEEHNGQRMLKVEIQNSGRHFEDIILRQINENSGKAEESSEYKGIGLRHTKKILEIMYGQEQLLYLENEKPEGTKVTVWIPREVQNEIINR